MLMTKHRSRRQDSEQIKIILLSLSSNETAQQAERQSTSNARSCMCESSSVGQRFRAEGGASRYVATG